MQTCRPADSVAFATNALHEKFYVANPTFALWAIRATPARPGEARSARICFGAFRFGRAGAFAKRAGICAIFCVCLRYPHYSELPPAPQQRKVPVRERPL